MNAHDKLKELIASDPENPLVARVRQLREKVILLRGDAKRYVLAEKGAALEATLREMDQTDRFGDMLQKISVQYDRDTLGDGWAGEEV
jgi:hypothetical protein